MSTAVPGCELWNMVVVKRESVVYHLHTCISLHVLADELGLCASTKSPSAITWISRLEVAETCFTFEPIAAYNCSLKVFGVLPSF